MSGGRESVEVELGGRDVIKGDEFCLVYLHGNELQEDHGDEVGNCVGSDVHGGMGLSMRGGWLFGLLLEDGEEVVDQVGLLLPVDHADRLEFVDAF